METVLKKKLALMRPLIMGILNVTPDSFSDGGKFYDGKAVDLAKIMEVAVQMVGDGADILDVGGESSGPGSQDVSLEEELKRVLPVVMALKAQACVLMDGEHSADLEAANQQLKSMNLFEQKQILISVDTWKAEVARQALKVGADLINDVTALRGDPELAQVLAQSKAPVVLMYSKDPTARTTREKVNYDDVMKTIADFFEERIAFALRAGIAREKIMLDPGMGAFVSADPKYSLQILKRLRELEKFGLPILIGASRKGFVGEIMNSKKVASLIDDRNREAKSESRKPFEVLPASERLEGSLACAAVATMNGASILRVHDVKETGRVVNMVSAIMKS